MFDNIKAMFANVWDFIVRWRTRLFNWIGAAVALLPSILGAPEIIAIIPPKYLPYVLAAVFLINYWMRPRVASRAADPEVQVAKEIKQAEGPVTVTVKEAGEKPVVIDA